MMVNINRVLLIREPWISLILAGEKAWEMRKSGCNIRGFVGVSTPGSGVISGIINIIDCLPKQTPAQLIESFDRHHVPVGSEFAQYDTPWVVTQAERLKKPISFYQKPGAVIWVKTQDLRIAQGSHL